MFVDHFGENWTHPGLPCAHSSLVKPVTNCHGANEAGEDDRRIQNLGRRFLRTSFWDNISKVYLINPNCTFWLYLSNIAYNLTNAISINPLALQVFEKSNGWQPVLRGSCGSWWEHNPLWVAGLACREPKRPSHHKKQNNLKIIQQLSAIVQYSDNILLMLTACAALTVLKINTQPRVLSPLHK